MSDEQGVNLSLSPAPRETDVPGAASPDIAQAEAAPAVNFPTIQRRVFDVLHDDERHEVWIGVRLRTPVKAKLTEDGPVEDIEMSFDGLSILASLDASKQEVLFALNADSQKLREEIGRKQALRKTGVLGRLTQGLGAAMGRAKSLIH